MKLLRYHRAILVKIAAVLITLGLAGAALVLANLLVGRSQVVTLPRPTGPYSVGRMEYDWVDAGREDPLAPDRGRQRELLVWVWYPASVRAGAMPAEYVPARWARAIEADHGVGALFFQRLDTVRVHAVADAPVSRDQVAYPVLVVVPGFGSIPANYTTLAEDLASHGYVVVGIAPTYSAPVVVFPDGRQAWRTPAGNIPEADDPAVVQKAADRLVGVWAADARFVLDQLAKLDAEPGGAFAGRLDLARVGVFGHSFDGATAAEVCRLDDRCRAGADLDGTLYGEAARVGLARPFLIVGSECGTPDDPACAQSEPGWQRAYAGGRHGGYLLTLRGARHFNFADYAVLFGPLYRPLGLLGPIDGRRGLEVTAAYLGGFFDEQLRGMPAPFLRQPSPDDPEVQLGR